LPDSIYFHETVGIISGGYPLAAISKSDESVLFRVPVGTEFNYTLGGTLGVWNPGYVGILASASVTLSHVEPGGNTLLATQSVQVGVVPPTEEARVVEFHGTLAAGDYLYEAHLHAQTAQYGGQPGGELSLGFWRWPRLTAIEPVSWGQVKALYRE
jgi:hypothetical protein